MATPAISHTLPVGPKPGRTTFAGTANWSREWWNLVRSHPRRSPTKRHVSWGGDDERPVWFGFDEKLAGLDREEWWLSHWQPWQLREMGLSRQSLDRMKRVPERQVAVCAAIREEYAPDSASFIQFGEGAITMETDEPCGRCPHCRMRGVPRTFADSTAPLQRWHSAICELENRGLGGSR